MAFGDSDAAVFFGDFGVDVTYNGVTVKGLVDNYDERNSSVAGALGMVDRINVVTVPSTAFPTMKRETNVVVDGTLYVVQDIMQKNDGGIMAFAVALP